MGLVSKGGVHSQQEHLYEIVRAADEAGLRTLSFMYSLMVGILFLRWLLNLLKSLREF